MPSRILREGILTSERVNKLSAPAEVFYRRLMSVVDDFGRYYAKPELLRAACFPLKLDKVGNPDIGKWIGETQEAALVRTYTVDGKAYLELADFRQQVRAKESKFPQSLSDAEHKPSACVADAEHPCTKTYSYSKSESESSKRAPQAAFVLPEWIPSEPWSAWIEVRTKLRAPNTPRALALAVGTLETLKAEGHDPAAVLNLATTRGWRGLFAPKTDDAGAGSGGNGNAVLNKLRAQYGPEVRLASDGSRYTNGNRSWGLNGEGGAAI